MESRVQKFQKDADEVVRTKGSQYNSSACYTLSDFDHRVEQNVLSFKWMTTAPGSVCRVSFFASEDYPENCLITQHWEKTGRERSHSRSITLPQFLKTIGEELLAIHEEAMSDDSDGEFSDCRSRISDDPDDFDQSDYYGGMDEFGIMIEDTGKSGMEKLNPLIQADMEMLKDVCSDQALSYRLLDSIGEIDVDLKIPLNFKNFTDQMAKAWKVNLKEPLVVRLHLSSVNYLDAHECPKIEVFQQSKGPCGIAAQMKNILDGFLRNQWRTLSNARLRTATSRSQSVPVNLSQAAAAAGFSEAGSRQQKVNDQDLARLIEMGFEHHVAYNALLITRGNLEEASMLLVSDRWADEDNVFQEFPPDMVDLRGSDASSRTDFLSPTDDRHLRPPDGGDIAFGSPLKSGSSKRKDVSPLEREEQATEKSGTRLDRQLSHPRKKSNKKKKDYSRSKSMTTSQTEPDLAAANFSLETASAQQLTNVKEVPSLENGFLVMMFKYAKQRIPTLNEFCVVCDEPHVFQNGAMLMPAVCSRELCVFAYQTLGIMVDAAADIATGAEVVDLLLAMTRAAVVSARKAVIFDPFPNIVDPNNPKELVFSEKHRDFGKVETLVHKFPNMREMMSISWRVLHAKLDETDKLLFPLLTWIISSNRSHIVKLPSERQLKFMVTPHQFLLLSSPPAKESAFQAAKEKYGSVFAFHGSGIENWHSIIRTGLIVASGTNKQVNGAAHGRGIYLSPVAAMSFSFSHMGHGRHAISKNVKSDSKFTTRFLSSHNLNCIALCEVINSPLLKQRGEIWVCADPEHVCTRFFFVYENGQVGENGIDMRIDKYRQTVQQAMTYTMRA